MRKMVTAGECLRTASGRITGPAPKGPSSRGDRATLNALKRLDAWLLREGIQEARTTGRDWLADMWSNMDPERMTETERESLNEVLWVGGGSE